MWMWCSSIVIESSRDFCATGFDLHFHRLLYVTLFLSHATDIPKEKVVREDLKQ